MKNKLPRFPSEIYNLKRCPVCSTLTERKGVYAEFKPIDDYGLAFRFCTFPHFEEFMSRYDVELLEGR